MMHEFTFVVGRSIFAVAQTHVDYVEHEVGFLRHAGPVADDLSGEHVDGEGDVDGSRTR